ncbi:unnamed protein product [Amoebophrya sp. A25]|nr:unnamed protein product [Amoebophrya sp. A25]|eukprot:GSA25T00000776001.1
MSEQQTKLSKGQKKKLRQKTFRASNAEFPSQRYALADLENFTCSSSSSTKRPLALAVQSLYGLFPPPAPLLDGEGQDFRLVPCVRWALLAGEQSEARCEAPTASTMRSDNSTGYGFSSSVPPPGRPLSDIVDRLRGLLTDSGLTEDEARFGGLIERVARRNFSTTSSLGSRGPGLSGQSRASPYGSSGRENMLGSTLRGPMSSGGASMPSNSSTQEGTFCVGKLEMLDAVLPLRVLRSGFVFRSSYLNWGTNGRLLELVIEYEKEPPTAVAPATTNHTGEPGATPSAQQEKQRLTAEVHFDLKQGSQIMAQGGESSSSSTSSSSSSSSQQPHPSNAVLDSWTVYGVTLQTATRDMATCVLDGRKVWISCPHTSPSGEEITAFATKFVESYLLAKSRAKQVPITARASAQSRSFSWIHDDGEDALALDESDIKDSNMNDPGPPVESSSPPACSDGNAGRGSAEQVMDAFSDSEISRDADDFISDLED